MAQRTPVRGFGTKQVGRNFFDFLMEQDMMAHGGDANETDTILAPAPQAVEGPPVDLYNNLPSSSRGTAPLQVPDFYRDPVLYPQDADAAVANLPPSSLGGLQGTAPQGMTNNLYDTWQTGTTNPPGVANPLQTNDPSSMSGMYTNEFLSSLSPYQAELLVNDPATFYAVYMDRQGIDANSGLYAMGAPNAESMPLEWLMTNPQDAYGTNERGDYYQQNIDAGMTPGSGYYTTGDFMGQAFTPGTEMHQYIWNSVDKNGNQITHDQQFSNFLGALDAIVGDSIGPEMMNNLASRYAASYREYQMALFAQPPYGGTLEDWFNSQGLGIPTAGGQ